MKLTELEEDLEYINEEVVQVDTDAKLKKADKMVSDLIEFFS